MPIEKAGTLGEYYNRDTDEKGFEFTADRVHCTGRYTEGLHPSEIKITDTTLKFTYPTIDGFMLSPETYTFTRDNDGKITSVQLPDGITEISISDLRSD